jgi:hypothetical protein
VAEVCYNIDINHKLRPPAHTPVHHPTGRTQLALSWTNEIYIDTQYWAPACILELVSFTKSGAVGILTEWNSSLSPCLQELLPGLVDCTESHRRVSFGHPVKWG